MSDDRAKTPRTLLIADHLWETYSGMALEMGSDRDGLVNQALYTFARLNGFLVPSDLQKLGVVPRASMTDSGRLRIAPSPAPLVTTEERPVPRPPAGPERVEVSQQLAAAGMPRRVSAPPPAPRAEPPAEATTLDDEPGSTSMDLPSVAGAWARPANGVRHAEPEAAAGSTLVLLAGDGRELERVEKDRFLIGRGKHCDLVINSGKVSREHAAIVREGDAWFIEDLGSSNGTWFDQRRLTRRQIQEGDEYYVCAEKLSCTFR
jgi:FHA domain-containing protein